MSLVLQVDAVVLGDGVRDVGEEWDAQLAEAALLARRVHPGQVCELRVDRAGHHLGAQRAELLHPVIERQNLSRTDERAVGKAPGEMVTSRSSRESRQKHGTKLRI